MKTKTKPPTRDIEPDRLPVELATSTTSTGVLLPQSVQADLNIFACPSSGSGSGSGSVDSRSRGLSRKDPLLTRALESYYAASIGHPNPNSDSTSTSTSPAILFETRQCLGTRFGVPVANLLGSYILPFVATSRTFFNLCLLSHHIRHSVLLNSAQNHVLFCVSETSFRNRNRSRSRNRGNFDYVRKLRVCLAGSESLLADPSQCIDASHLCRVRQGRGRGRGRGRASSCGWCFRGGCLWRIFRNVVFVEVVCGVSNPSVASELNLVRSIESVLRRRGRADCGDVEVALRFIRACGDDEDGIGIGTGVGTGIGFGRYRKEGRDAEEAEGHSVTLGMFGCTDWIRGSVRSVSIHGCGSLAKLLLPECSNLEKVEIVLCRGVTGSFFEASRRRRRDVPNSNMNMKSLVVKEGLFWSSFSDEDVLKIGGSHLVKLELSWCRGVTGRCLHGLNSLRNLDVVEGLTWNSIRDEDLVCLRKLRSLRLVGCGRILGSGLRDLRALTKVSFWHMMQLGDAVFAEMTSLRSVEIVDCPHVTGMALRLLPFLSKLVLGRSKLFTDDLFSTQRSFLSLTSLALVDCKNITGRCLAFCDDEDDIFFGEISGPARDLIHNPVTTLAKRSDLRDVVIQNCPNFDVVPGVSRGWLSRTRRLSLLNCPSACGNRVLRRLPKIERLEVHQCPNLEPRDLAQLVRRGVEVKYCAVNVIQFA